MWPVGSLLHPADLLFRHVDSACSTQTLLLLGVRYPSSLTGIDHLPGIARQILNHWNTRKVSLLTFLMVSFEAQFLFYLFGFNLMKVSFCFVLFHFYWGIVLIYSVVVVSGIQQSDSVSYMYTSIHMCVCMLSCFSHVRLGGKLCQELGVEEGTVSSASQSCPTLKPHGL